MKNSDVEMEHLSEKRTSINYFTLVPMIVLLIVACFLVINVALGLFGVMWYNINQRRGEIGLRRAIGAEVFPALGVVREMAALYNSE